jgi:hypothetical protein
MGSKSRKHILIGTLLALVMLTGGLLLFVWQKSSTVQLGGQTFAVRVADTPEKRQQGLSGTEPLGSNQGMLFVFETEDYHGIWMKDMNYPIDIIWLGMDKTVVSVSRNVSPGTYPETFRPSEPARYVLELPAGAAQEHAITTGVVAEF